MSFSSPPQRRLPDRARASLLARGVPAFSAIAIVSATLLALTGSLNTTVHLTSAEQFITTAYGRTLTVKIEIFLVMVIISAWHAFHLRPRLARALATEDARVAHPPLRLGAAVAASGESAGRSPAATTPDIHAQTDAPPTPLTAQRAHLRHAPATSPGAWRTGCGARPSLVAPSCSASRCSPSSPAHSPRSGQRRRASSGAYIATNTVSGYHVKLDVNPATFGTNTFTVTVTDPQGKPASDASVLIITENLDMDMGQQSLQLQPSGSAQPGAYSGTSDLTMAGHWQVTVKVLPHGTQNYLTTQFKLIAGS